MTGPPPEHVIHIAMCLCRYALISVRRLIQADHIWGFCFPPRCPVKAGDLERSASFCDAVLYHGGNDHEESKCSIVNGLIDSRRQSSKLSKFVRQAYRGIIVSSLSMMKRDVTTVDFLLCGLFHAKTSMVWFSGLHPDR